MDHIKLIYSGQHNPIEGKSIFLAGCSPKKDQVLTWRKDILKLFLTADFKGTIIIPEPQEGRWENYDNVVEWEDTYLKQADVILFWLPRNISNGIYGFTSNIEFGKYLESGKIVYGRPNESDNNRYLDYWYKKIYDETPADNLNDLVTNTMNVILNIQKNWEYK